MTYLSGLKGRLKEALIQLIIGLIGIGLMYLYYRDGDNELKNNGVYTNAVIYEIYIPTAIITKRSSHLYYYYVVNGTKYDGVGNFSKRKDTLSVGDSILIVYDREKPKVSHPYRDL